MDWALLNVPDFIVTEVITPFVKIKRPDRIPVIRIHAFDDGEEFAHGFRITLVVALRYDQTLPFPVITDRGWETSLGQDERLVNSFQLPQQGTQAMFKGDQPVMAAARIA